MARNLMAFAVSAVLAGPAVAQPQVPVEALDWMRMQIGMHIQRSPYLWGREQIDAMVRPTFLAASRDGKTVTAEDRQVAIEFDRAQVRAGLMNRFLMADVDGSGRIDRARLGYVLRNPAQSRLTDAASIDREVERYFVDTDRDGDGIVTYSEAVAAADHVLTSQHRSVMRIVPPAEMDLDADGVITLIEFQTVVDSAFAQIDTDRDGRLSEAEVKLFQTATLPAAQRAAVERGSRAAESKVAREKAARCAIPSWNPKTMLIAVSAGEGTAWADVSIGNREITAFSLDIEPGDRPISIALDTPSASLWQFTGEVSRIASVYVAPRAQEARPSRRARGQSGQVGVVGVPAAKISFAAEQDCLKAEDAREAGARRRTTVLGRTPDVAVQRVDLSAARLPSGEVLDEKALPNRIALPKVGPGEALWNMASTGRGAIVHVDPASVVARDDVKRGPLPGVAGLAQLVDEGSAKIVGWKTVTRFEGPNSQIGPTIIGGSGVQITGFEGQARVSKVPSEILILRQVTLPTGLGRSGFDRLIVARGAGEPLGDRSDICIVREEDGRPLDGSTCR